VAGDFGDVLQLAISSAFVANRLGSQCRWSRFPLACGKPISIILEFKSNDRVIVRGA